MKYGPAFSKLLNFKTEDQFAVIFYFCEILLIVLKTATLSTDLIGCVSLALQMHAAFCRKGFPHPSMIKNMLTALHA